MKAQLKLFNKNSNEETNTIFYFKSEDVRSFYRSGDNIVIFLYGQGEIFLDYDEEIYEQLEQMFEVR